MSLCEYFGTAASEELSIAIVWNFDQLVTRQATSGPHVRWPASDHGGRGLRILSPSPLARVPDYTAYELLRTIDAYGRLEGALPSPITHWASTLWLSRQVLAGGKG